MGPKVGVAVVPGSDTGAASWSYVGSAVVGAEDEEVATVGFPVGA